MPCHHTVRLHPVIRQCCMIPFQETRYILDERSSVSDRSCHDPNDRFISHDDAVSPAIFLGGTMMRYVKLIIIVTILLACIGQTSGDMQDSDTGACIPPWCYPYWGVTDGSICSSTEVPLPDGQPQCIRFCTIECATGGGRGERPGSRGPVYNNGDRPLFVEP